MTSPIECFRCIIKINSAYTPILSTMLCICPFLLIGPYDSPNNILLFIGNDPVELISSVEQSLQLVAHEVCLGGVSRRNQSPILLAVIHGHGLRVWVYVGYPWHLLVYDGVCVVRGYFK